MILLEERERYRWAYLLRYGYHTLVKSQRPRGFTDEENLGGLRGEMCVVYSKSFLPLAQFCIKNGDSCLLAYCLAPRRR